MQNNEIQQALNAALSSLHVSDTEAGMLLAQAKGGKKVKKKLSIVIVLTAVLIIISLGALAAALLSMRDLVEQQVVPMASQSTDESLTMKDTNKILELAEENGIQLSNEAKDKIQNALNQGEGYFKWELLMELAKADFGQQPQTWSLEQQKWFSDVTVAMGLFEQADKEISIGGEDAKLPIIQAAKDCIREKYDNDAPLDDPQKYQIGVQYINGDVDGDYPGLYWVVDFQPKYLKGAEYWIYLRNDMTVFNEWVRKGLQGNETVLEIRDIYNRIYPSMHTWPEELLRSFRNAAMMASDTNSREYLCLTQTAYPDIPPNAISKEQAFELAAKYLLLKDYRKGHGYFIGDQPNPIWKVSIFVDSESWGVEVDSITGEIKSERRLNGQYGKWWMMMVRWDVLDSVDKNWTENIPPSIG